MCSKNKSGRIDKCIRNLVAALKFNPSFDVLASCCGHGRYPMTLIVRDEDASGSVIRDLISGARIPRTRNFYRKDVRGFYYIPEVSKPKD